MVSDPTEDFYENLEELFANCKIVDEDLEQLRVNAVSTAGPLNTLKLRE